jgi:outer membrane biosynthesis protein TonB
MSRPASIRLLAAALALASEAAQAQRSSAPAAGTAARWRTAVTVCRFAEREIGEADPVIPVASSRTCWQELEGLVLPEDIPADLRRRRFDGRSVVAVDATAEGRAQTCRVTASAGDARLDRVACDKIVHRARFRPFYSGPGRPIAARWHLFVTWDITDAPPPVFAVPVPPVAPVAAPRPRPWPRFDWWGPFELVSLPRIQGAFPGDSPSDGVVGLDLIVTPQTGIEDCVVGMSGGDAALDAAACRVARSVELRYPRSCVDCVHEIVPLQVHWRRRGGSHIRFPLPWEGRPGGVAPIKDPADTRAAVSYRPQARMLPFRVSRADYRGIRDRTISSAEFHAALDVDASGRVTVCRSRGSTGNQAIERRTCQLIVRRARYLPRTDVFGDPVPSRALIRGIRLDTVL